MSLATSYHAASALDLDTLTPAESAELDQHVANVKAHLETLVSVVESLDAIKEKRLFRQTHETFADFCRDEFGLSISSLSRARRALTVKADIEQAGLPAPTAESQVRELAAVPDSEERVAIWREATDEAGGVPTAKAVRSKMEERGYVKSEPVVDGDDEPVNVMAEVIPAVPAFAPKACPQGHDPRSAEEASFLDAIPVRDLLDDRVRRVFDADALTWRRAIRAGHAAAVNGAKLVLAAQPGDMRMPFSSCIAAFLKSPDKEAFSRLTALLKSPAPNAWRSCVECIRDGVSTGTGGDGKKCVQCRGNGYHV